LGVDSVNAFKPGPKRYFYHMNDRRDGVFKLTPDSRARLRNQYECPGHSPDYACPFLSLRWSEHPEPIDVVVKETVPNFVSMFDDGPVDLTVLDKAVLEALAPHCRDMYVGKVLLDTGTGDFQPTGFVTVAAPKHQRIQSDRGRHCRHKHWGCCGVFSNQIGWASGAIVERTLNSRQVYVDQQGWLLVSDELATQLELRSRFPKLWLYRIEVVPEPLDGEILPGDPRPCLTDRLFGACTARSSALVRVAPLGDS
jgi:hypothetical protein